MNDELTITNEDQDLVFSIEPSKRKTVRKARVNVEGKMNLYNAAFIVEKIGEIVNKWDIVDFKLQGITEIDLSALQTMYYYKSLFTSEEKRINFQLLELPAEVNTIINKSKYNKILFQKPSRA
ncbi:MAG: hypothetical protein ACFHWX_01700 [Bacteroidota bacterium]